MQYMTNTTSIRFSDEELSNLKTSAEGNGRTVSQEIRHRLFSSPLNQYIDHIEDAKTPVREPVDPPVKKSANPRTQGRPEPKVAEIEGLKPGERYETKEERAERMDRMRKEMGIKERPSTWETKHGKGKQP